MGEETENRVFKHIEKTTEEQSDGPSGRPHVHTYADWRRRQQQSTAQKDLFLHITVSRPPGRSTRGVCTEAFHSSFDDDLLM